MFAARARDRACYAEIGECRVSLEQEHVRGLDVAMYDALLMCVRQCVRDLANNAERDVDVERSVAVHSMPQ